jgi:DNA-binding transcriptional ArsR family regulator
MLMSLMDGRALTAGELSRAAGVMPPTASEHLARMFDAGLLAMERQGRHRYYRLAGASVAGQIEGLMALSDKLCPATLKAKPIRTGPRDEAMRRARLCYDHLAGKVAVELAAAMVARGQLELGAEGAAVTQRGFGFLLSLGIDIPTTWQRGPESAFCRTCLDWSERRPHIAGTVGRSLYLHFANQGWLRRVNGSRAVEVAPLGARELRRHFDIAPG